MWQSEENGEELVLSIHPMGSEVKHRGLGMAVGAFTPSAMLSAQALTFYCYPK